MGFYLNVKEDKREWLEKHGRAEHGQEVSFAPFLYNVDRDEALVCLVVNPEFDAAGIIFSEMELERCADPTDPRPRRWFAVRKDDLAPHVANWDRIPWTL